MIVLAACAQPGSKLRLPERSEPDAEVASKRPLPVSLFPEETSLENGSKTYKLGVTRKIETIMRGKLMKEEARLSQVKMKLIG